MVSIEKATSQMREGVKSGKKQDPVTTQTQHKWSEMSKGCVNACLSLSVFVCAFVHVRAVVVMCVSPVCV
jgi:hypothetical protein